MAINWYPIINEDLCINCNSCVDFCKNGVFEAGDLHPIVVAPERCIEFCRGCAKLCPQDAITYYTDHKVQ